VRCIGHLNTVDIRLHGTRSVEDRGRIYQPSGVAWAVCTGKFGSLYFVAENRKTLWNERNGLDCFLVAYIFVIYFKH
jgi:hypothetical protein